VTYLRIWHFPDTETHDLRAVAAYAVADIGTPDDRLRLRHLLNIDRAADTNDEIRGAALRAIYPRGDYDDSMWQYLEHPQQSNFFGAYDAFMTYMVLPKLGPSNLPAALRWSEQQKHQEIGPVAELQHGILSRAVEHIESEEVADLLARAVLARAESGYESLRSYREKGFDERLAEDQSRRRRFFEAFLPILGRNKVHFLTYPRSLLFLEDLEWLIDRVVNNRSPAAAGVESWMVHQLARSWETSTIEAVRQACQKSAVLAEECKGFFDPWSLDSPEAQWARQSDGDAPKKKDIPVALAMEPRCDAALRRSEEGDVDAWLRLLNEMSVEEGGTHFMSLRDMEVQKLPGWSVASEGLKARMIVAAKVFLEQTSFQKIAWFPSNRIPDGAVAALNAIVFLNEVESGYLKKQHTAFWVQWIPSLIGGSLGRETNDAINSVFKMAAIAAPGPMNTYLLAQVAYEDRANRYLFCGASIEAAWSETLAGELLATLQQDELTTDVQGDLLYRLIDHKFPGAIEWATQTIAASNNSARKQALAKALLIGDDDTGWGTIWSMIRSDASFGRALMADVSYGLNSRASSFTNRLSDAELGDLFTWLLEQYPPDDGMVSGAMGPTDTIRFLRDGILEQLKARSTFEACDALARAKLHLPQHRWLGHHIDAAEVMACSSTWKAHHPREIIAMAADAHRRLVDSSVQLLALVLESLRRLQAKLHGELSAVADLWNSRDKDWWPKEEEDISDYVARHLRDDLTDRNIVINREVQIRRGRRGEMRGQNTDIHIDATPVDGTQAEIYGATAVIVEVKGSWNNGLMQDMEVQLRDRYLKKNACFTGLYLVAHFIADRWTPDDWRRAKSEAIGKNDLTTKLAAQAASLSEGVNIASFVLDASLNSTGANSKRKN
jgi:hypothetical protein